MCHKSVVGCKALGPPCVIKVWLGVKLWDRHMS